MESLYLVCYDIADAKRLRKVHKVTEDRGKRLQYSVYECTLTPLLLAEFKADLLDLIKASEDQVLFIRLGPRNPTTYEKIESLGRSYEPSEHRSFVV